MNDIDQGLFLEILNLRQQLADLARDRDDAEHTLLERITAQSTEILDLRDKLADVTRERDEMMQRHVEINKSATKILDDCLALSLERKSQLLLSAASELRMREALNRYGHLEALMSLDPELYHFIQASLTTPPSELAAALINLEGAATAILEDAECRMDEDCDHCVLAQALSRVQAALNPSTKGDPHV